MEPLVGATPLHLKARVDVSANEQDEKARMGSLDTAEEEQDRDDGMSWRRAFKVQGSETLKQLARQIGTEYAPQFLAAVDQDVPDVPQMKQLVRDLILTVSVMDTLVNIVNACSAPADVPDLAKDLTLALFKMDSCEPRSAFKFLVCWAS
jgi:hypothetical protein